MGKKRKIGFDVERLDTSSKELVSTEVENAEPVIETNKVEDTILKEATVPVYIRKKPYGEIVRVLEKGEKIEALETIKVNGTEWTKVVNDNYIMSEFLK